MNPSGFGPGPFPLGNTSRFATLLASHRSDIAFRQVKSNLIFLSIAEEALFLHNFRPSGEFEALL